MPRRSITARDRRLPMVVNETISSSPNNWKPTWRAPLAASEASPLPQCWNARRQPISTHGEHGRPADGMCKPTNPMNSCVSLDSAAQKPQPRSSISNWQRSAIASLSKRVSGEWKNSITLASELRAANGSRSAGFHCRKQRRSVSNSITSTILRCQTMVTHNKDFKSFCRTSNPKDPRCSDVQRNVWGMIVLLLWFYCNH